MKDDTDTMDPAMNVIEKFRDTIKFLNLILFMNNFIFFYC